jgi:general secretion pathway protein I
MNPLKTASAGQLRRRSAGFTLLEVMLAFVIFALSFATVLEIMAASMHGVGRAKDDTEVALLAQTLMDQVGIEIPVEEGEYSGTNMDRYRWKMGVSLYDAGTETGTETEGEGMITQELADLSGIELYRVDLYVDWEAGKRERSLHFSTIHSVLANRP